MYLLEPKTKQAEEWIDENVQTEPWQWLGKSLAIDHHYIEGLIFGLLTAGLEMSIDFDVIHA